MSGNCFGDRYRGHARQLLAIFFSPVLCFRILDEGQREVTIDNSLASRLKVDPREVLVTLNGKDINNSIAPL